MSARRWPALFSSPLALALGVGLLAACDDGGAPVGDDDDDDSAPGADAAVPAPDAADESLLQPLVEGEWSLPAGSERYVCVYKTLDRTVYAGAFAPIIPAGTHHTVLTIGPKQREDGVYTCGASTNYNSMVFGSGVGTNALELPAGLAVELEAGQQLLLNLHLFNASDAELTGVSGTAFLELAPQDVEHQVEALMASKFGLSIPPGESTHTGTCYMNGDVTLISMSPHMHMMGSHMKVWAESSVVGDVDLWDRPYDFDAQVVELLPEPVPMRQGDAVKVQCSYLNTSEQTIGWGDSSLDEMCIAGIYRYPPRGGGIICATN